MSKAYKKLTMWVLADELAREVYRLSIDFPKSEVYGLTSQLRRAAVSVVLNIVEGHARRSVGDFRRFLDIALGSLSEVEYLLELAVSLEYLSKQDFIHLEGIRSECGKCLWSYRQKLKNL